MAGPDDGIDGEPGVMQAVDVAGPTGTYKAYEMDSKENLVSRMPEGQAFVTKDGPATERLTQFVFDTARGFEAYTNRAKDAGHDYLGADEGGEAAIKAVEAITRNRV